MDRRAPGRNPLARYGIWGHPWHGLVTAGQLTLPNEQVVSYRQPSGANAYDFGSTTLVAVPGVPDVVRTPAQLADDEAAGRQWWNKAIISGNDQVYGKGVSGLRWIYTDPDGARWMVTALAANTLRLRRFGAFGRAAEVHDYEVSGAPAPLGTPYSVKPDGTAAVMTQTEPVVRPMTGEPPANQWLQPASVILQWFEVRLSGPGAALEVAVETLYTAEQAAGTVVSDVPFTGVYQKWELTGLPVGASVSTLQISAYTETPTAEFRPLAAGSGEARYEVAGIIVAVWYGQAGERRTLSLRGLYKAEYSLPPFPTPTITGATTQSGGAWLGAVTVVSSRTYTCNQFFRVSLEQDGEVLDYIEWRANVAGNQSRQAKAWPQGGYANHTPDRTATDILQWDWTVQSRVEWDGGARSSDWTETKDNGGSLSPASDISGSLIVLPMGFSMPSYNDSTPQDGFPELDPHARLGIADLRRRLSMYRASMQQGWGIHRLANHLVSLVLYGVDDPAEAATDSPLLVGGFTVQPAACATPAGAANLGGYVATGTAAGNAGNLPRYGSWCPVTGRVARSLIPVCWV